MASDKRLYRSRDAVIGGVCAGIADYFTTDALTVRLLAILIVFISAGLGIIPYVIMWASVPQAPSSATPVDVQPEEVHSATFGRAEDKFCAPCGKAAFESEDKRRRVLIQVMLVVGSVLLIVGLMSLVSSFVRGLQWWQCWPLLLVVMGIIRMVVPGRPGHELMAFAVGFVVFALGVLLFALTLSSLNEVVLTTPYGKEYFFNFPKARL